MRTRIEAYLVRNCLRLPEPSIMRITRDVQVYMSDGLSFDKAIERAV